MMTAKTGFFRALSGVVSGTAVFHDLRCQSWGRTIWHLLLLSLLLAIAITWGETGRRNVEISRTAAAFQAEFGDHVQCSEDGILPAAAPRRPRNFAFSADALLCYLGSSRQLELSDSALLNTNVLVVWGGKLLASAVRGSDGSWQLQCCTPEGTRLVRCAGTAELLIEINRHAADPDEDWELEKVTVSTADIFRLVRVAAVIGNISYWLPGIFILPWLYTGIFMLVTRLTGNRQYPHLGLRGTWKTGIYAGFPAMLVAAAFPALDLPFFTYSTVYMIGLVIYWMTAALRIEHDLAAASSANSGENLS